MEKGKDRAGKLFFSVKDHASELINIALKGKGVRTRPSDLSAEDPAVQFVGRNISLEKLVDKMYRVDIRDTGISTCCIVGIENQSSQDAEMLVRAGIASLLIYNRSLKMRQDLKPAYIVVLNMSEGKWRGKKSLSEYFSPEDIAFFGPLPVDVNILVVDPYEMEDEEINSLKTDLRLVLNVIRYKGDKSKFFDYIMGEKGFEKLDDVTAKLISELSNIEIKEGKMCKAVEQFKNECIAEGIAEGKAQGISEALFKLAKEGFVPRQKASEMLGITMEEFTRREAEYFASN